MSSSSKSRDQLLGVISAKRAEKLILDAANLPISCDAGGNICAKARERLRFLYPEVFAPIEDPMEFLGFVIALRDLLQRAWDAPDVRHRDWLLFKTRDFYHQTLVFLSEKGKNMRSSSSSAATKRGIKENMRLGFEVADMLIAVPPITAFEASVFHFQQVADRARHCPNPTCPAPYFLAAKRSQKYCSEACAGPALREAKRRWWNENRAKREK